MDIPLFRSRFPHFASSVIWPDPTIEVAAETASCFIDVANSWYRCDKCRELITELMTAHILYLNGSPLQPGSTAVGVVSSATVGTVSVGLTVNTASKGAFSAWLGKTPWGEQLLAMLARISGGPIYVGGSPERRAFRKFGGRF